LEKSLVFEKELKFIKSEKIRDFVVKALEATPDYFFSIPASSTGKYHPGYALGDGGLVRHTRACARIAVELFRMEMFNYLSDNDKDIILASLILHDTRKNGDGSGKYTVTEHPILAKFSLDNNPDLNKLLIPEELELITNNIKTHMGQWTKDFKTGEEVLEKPKTRMQNLVHLVDYLASRKCLEMNFDVELFRD
jgi:hypothetical protein